MGFAEPVKCNEVLAANSGQQTRPAKAYQRAVRIFQAARQLPAATRKLIFTKIDRDKIGWMQLSKMHEKIMQQSAFLWGAGVGAYGIGNVMRSHDILNWYSNHNSNFTVGIGIIMTLDNALASALPHHRKKVAALIYGAFGLANLGFETSLFMGNTNDFKDLTAAGAAIVMAAAIQYVHEKSQLIRIASEETNSISSESTISK